VTVFHRGEKEPPEKAGAEHVHGDFRRLTDYVPRLAQRRPEVVIDVVPYIDKVGHGVRHFRGVAERAVVITSGDVYRAFAVAWGSEAGDLESVPLTEDSATRSGHSPDLSPDIGFDNLEVEQALAADPALPVTVFRLPMVYGEADPQRRLERYVRRMADRRPAIVLDARLANCRWSRGYVENVASAIVLGATNDRAAGRTYNVAEPTTPTELEWIGLVADACGWGGEVVAVAPEDLPRRLRTRLRAEQDLFVSSSRLRAELGYEEPVSLSEGLRQTVEWEREQQQDEPQPDYSDEDRVLATRPFKGGSGRRSSV
jgi:nucleoside-diphosphate-sugar epimerase